MGIDITITDPAISYRSLGIGFATPDIADLEGWYWLGTDQGVSVINHAGGNDAVVLGNPTYGSGYASFAAAALSTGLEETGDQTIIVVARNTDTLVDSFHVPQYVSTFDGTSQLGVHTSNGTIIWWNTAGSIAGNCSTWSGSVSTSRQRIVASSSTSAWRAISFRTRSDLMETTNLTQSLSNSLVLTEARDPNITPYRIGNNSTLTAGTCDIAAVVIFSRYISVSERTQVYNILQAEMSNFSITV